MHIAIIGCGQLARMLALEGWRLGLSFSFLAEPTESRSCVTGLGTIVERNDDMIGETLFKALGEPAVVTVEREHVDTVLLASLTPFCKVCPNSRAIEISQHRGREKGFLNDQGVPTAPYELASSAEAIKAAIQKLDVPVIVKTCGDGYDGKGQWKIESTQDIDRLVSEIEDGNEYIVEKLIHFDKEVSIISARSADGQSTFYPLTENRHNSGILISSIAPAESPTHTLSIEAKRIATKVLEELDYVGVLSIEFFVVNDTLLVNEIAPRVHNSGHWTQAGGVSSQFENHLRSITGMTLGATTPAINTGMVNVLGQKADIALPIENNMQLHSYNKAPKPGRKMGHINAWSTDREQLIDQLNRLTNSLHDITN